MEIDDFMKINLISPIPKGSKLIFSTPFRVGVITENHSYIF